MKPVFTPVKICAFPSEADEGTLSLEAVKSSPPKCEKCENLEEFILFEVNEKVKSVNAKTHSVIEEQNKALKDVEIEQERHNNELMEVKAKLKEQFAKLDSYMEKLQEMKNKGKSIEENINKLLEIV